MTDTTIPEDVTELVGLQIPRVDLVGKAANGLRFLVAKEAQDAPPVDIESLVNKETAVSELAGVDDLDVTQPLAEVDGVSPVDATVPGSPAWEAVDCATAVKWTGILSRAKNALNLLSERELIESDVNADWDASDNSWDLADAAGAIDFAIDMLAPYAAGEAAEVAISEEAGNAIAKAVADLEGLVPSIETIEGLAPIAKSGRILSSANETLVRSAIDSLTTVVNSLPAAPDAVEKEGAVSDPTENATSEVADGDGAVAKTADEANGETSTTVQFTTSTVVAKSAIAAAPRLTIRKADGDTPMQAVFDADGNLIGVVDPAEIQPVAGAGSAAADADGDGTPDGAEAPADTAPAPAADAGTTTAAATAAPAAPAPAATAADDGSVTKSEIQAALEELVPDLVAKAAEAVQATADNEVLKEQIKQLTATAPPRVLANGVAAPKSPGRGQDYGVDVVDVAKGEAARAEFASAADPVTKARAADVAGSAARAEWDRIRGTRQN